MKTKALKYHFYSLSPTCYLPFYLKVSKSIHRVAQRVPLSHLRNGLANFLNKTAELHEYDGIVFNVETHLMDCASNLTSIPNSCVQFTKKVSASGQTLPYTIQLVLDKAWYYRIWLVYCMPFIITIGLFNNVVSILIMQIANLQIGTRFKVYYTIISVFYLSTVLSVDLFSYYLEDGLALSTGGKFFFLTRSYSTWACKISAAVWRGSIMISNYTLACFCIERMIVVCFPLKSKSLVTKKRIILQWIIIVIPLFLITIPLTLYNDDLIQIADDRFVCSPANPNSVWYFIYAWSGCFLYYFFHACLMLGCSVIIALKLSYSVSGKSKLTVGSKTTNRKEIQAALTVVSLAILQCCSYFPTTVFCMVFCLAAGDPQFQVDHPESFAGIAIAYDMVNVTFSLSHCWNFYIYLQEFPPLGKLSSNGFVALPEEIKGSQMSLANQIFHNA